MMARSTTDTTPSGKRGDVYRATARGAAAAARKLGQEARHAVSNVANTTEARLAIARAREAVTALGQAAKSATALVVKAWQTSGGHVRAFGSSREFHALRRSARSAARMAAATAYTASAAVGKRGAAVWKRAVSGGKGPGSRSSRRLRATARKRSGA